MFGGQMYINHIVRGGMQEHIERFTDKLCCKHIRHLTICHMPNMFTTLSLTMFFSKLEKSEHLNFLNRRMRMKQVK